MPDKRTLLSELVLETQRREKQEKQRPVCGHSWVQALQGSIVLNGVSHSGVATHICNLGPNHEGWCECTCGVRGVPVKE